MKIERLGTGGILPSWESCFLLAVGTKIGCNRQGCSPGAGACIHRASFHKAEHAKVPFPIRASPGFRAHEKLLQLTAAGSQTPLN